MSFLSKRSPKASKRTNRKLTPEERLAHNIASENRETRKKARPHRKSAGHAKPLGKPAGPSVDSGRTPSRWSAAFKRAFAPVRSSLTGEWLGGPEVIRHLPFIGFIAALMLGYTYLEYKYEYDERAIKEGRKELMNLRHHEQSLRGRFESQLQRSRLDEDMAAVGLSAPKAPPTSLPAPNPVTQ
jgi:hypothetical protein